MKRLRKQLVIWDGKRMLVDVPEDDVLYRLDCHAEYLRVRSLRFDTPLDSASLFLSSPRESQPDFIVEQFDMKRRLAEAVSHLSNGEMRLLRLRFEQELGQAEIARLLDCSQQKISKDLRLILVKLRAELEE